MKQILGPSMGGGIGVGRFSLPSRRHLIQGVPNPRGCPVRKIRYASYRGWSKWS
ncbi:hypothetical protein BGW80DRAFT_1263875 [Lactifluus volemus]|nr:hypothetical protein BGW80DRAFT_1418041 [Lactifluus volemus]KAH9959140.1 hypothetical protein BGW80DRAFT_1370665 [Lactifluus volemus]KAH9982575.1 hypothetical protein BGW80DRAFT_1263875 [Lactifluus volemus]